MNSLRREFPLPVSVALTRLAPASLSTRGIRMSDQPHQPDEPTQPVAQPGSSHPSTSPYGSPYQSAPSRLASHDPAPPTYGYPPPPPRKGFFGALFDLSFTSYVTPMVVGVIYVLGMVAITVGLVIGLVAGFVDSLESGILVLVLGPLVALVYLVLWRMLLEFYVAVTRMADDIHRRLPRA